MEVTQDSIAQLYDALDPFLNIVVMQNNDSVTTPCVLASMNDLVYSFFCEHYWENKGLVIKMIEKIVSRFSEQRFERFRLVTNENIVLALESEFVIWKRVRKCLMITFLSIDTLVHVNYINTILNNSYRDSFVKQLQSQMNISKKLMAVLSSWRMKGFIDQKEELGRIFKYLEGYDTNFVLFLSNEFLLQAQKDYKVMSEKFPINNPIQLQEVYSKEVLLINETLPLVKRNAITYLNTILLADRCEDFKCISNTLGNTEELTALIELAEVSGIEEKVFIFLKDGVKEKTKIQLEQYWSDDAVSLGDGILEFSKKIDRVLSVLKGQWIEYFKKGISEGILSLEPLKKSPDLLAVLLAEYCNHIVSSFCTSEEIGLICDFISLLNNKDILLIQYAKYLPDKIMYGDEINFETNSCFIKRLTNLIGKALTYPIQQMLSELQSSQIFTQQISKILPIQTNVNVLSNQKLFRPPFGMKLPPLIDQSWKIINDQYNSIHEKRKLVLCDNSSIVECVINKCKIQIPLPHYCVLLLCQNEQRNEEVISKENKFDIEITQVIIEDLIKSQLLISKENKTFIFNGEFNKAGNLKIKCNFKKKSKTEEIKSENDEVEERRFQMVISILVRIMKRLKRISYQDLCRLTVDELKKSFVPDVRILKKGVEYMLENEYAQRDETDKNTLIYMV
ncbi:cullin, putative [Entamoeba histolytica HM-3:IMSS]|uniref:Cullin, putative n=1 Tax=Entamoeba histolytica HM-3:IMSS TaxID=885315 RepID=M7W092_ENTHI|nr:cullin, putative [Entamoeba histolytica HM-3:IMSS]